MFLQGEPGKYYDVIKKNVDCNALFRATDVIDAMGIKRTFKPIIVCYDDTKLTELKPKENLEYSLTLLRGGQGALFPVPGFYEVFIEVNWNLAGVEVVTVGENGISEADILVHDAYEMDTTVHNMLIRLSPPHFPMALGIIREVNAPTYDQLVEQQYQQSLQKASFNNVEELLKSGNTWEVK